MLDEQICDLIAIGLNGDTFAHYATSNILSLTGLYESTRYWLLISCFTRKDAEGVKRFLNDWKNHKRKQKPKVNISKFVPGEHYYCLNTKFDTYLEAEAYIHSQGYDVGMFIETNVYRDE